LIHYNRKKNQKRGFTLIELLVVIAIIALLLAILMPALNAVKKHAHAVICLSNQKQIGVAAGLYAGDYRDWIPRGDEDGKMIWYQCFLPYIGRDRDMVDLTSLKIYRCGAYPKNGSGSNNIPNSRQVVCYVINAWTGLSNKEAVATKTTRFKSPSSKVYLADNEAGPWRPVIETLQVSDPTITRRNDVYYAGHLPSSTNETSHTDGRRIAKDRHADGCNMLFLDWHAEQVKAKDITMRMFREK